MIITIDTQKDSPQEIKKLMAMLQALVNESGSYSSYENYPGSNTPASPEQTTNMMSMFGDDSGSSSVTAANATPGTAPNFGSFLNLVDKKAASKKYLDEPKLEFY
jgi:hypothetical protein